METRHRSPLRMLAPVALVVFGLALLLVVATSGGSGEDTGNPQKAAEEERDLGGKSSTTDDKAGSEDEPGEEKLRKFYRVKSGDTLGGIAESTGIPVERLQELNPGLDQFSLVDGQRIKLR